MLVHQQRQMLVLLCFSRNDCLQVGDTSFSILLGTAYSMAGQGPSLQV